MDEEHSGMYMELVEVYNSLTTILEKKHKAAKFSCLSEDLEHEEEKIQKISPGTIGDFSEVNNSFKSKNKTLVDYFEKIFEEIKLSDSPSTMELNKKIEKAKSAILEADRLRINLNKNNSYFT